MRHILASAIALALTGAAGTLSASPSGSLSVTEDGPNGLTLTSSNGYVGPGAVTLEVTDQSAENGEAGSTAPAAASPSASASASDFPLAIALSRASAIA